MDCGSFTSVSASQPVKVLAAIFQMISCIDLFYRRTVSKKTAFQFCQTVRKDQFAGERSSVKCPSSSETTPVRIDTLKVFDIPESIADLRYIPLESDNLFLLFSAG